MRRVSKILVKYFVFCGTVFPSLVCAELTPYLGVVQVGGQNDTIFIQLTEPVGTELGCSHSQVRIPPSAFSDKNTQRRLYSSALMALATGKTMKFYLTKCNGAYPYFDENSGYWWIR